MKKFTPRMLFTLPSLLLLSTALTYSNGSSSASLVQCDPNKYHGWVDKDTCTIYSFKCDDAAEYKASRKIDCEKSNNGPCRSWCVYSAELLALSRI